MVSNTDLIFFCFQDVLSEVSRCRLAASVAVPALIAFRGLRKQSLSLSGCALALWVGFVLTLAHPAIMLGLITFFLTSSKATRFRQHLKRKIEGEAFKAGKYVQMTFWAKNTTLCMFHEEAGLPFSLKHGAK